MYFNRCFLKDVAANVYIYIMAYNDESYDGVLALPEMLAFKCLFQISVMKSTFDRFVIKYVLGAVKQKYTILT